MQVGSNRTERLARLLGVDFVASRVVVAGRVDDNEFAIGLAAVINVRERSFLL